MRLRERQDHLAHDLALRGRQTQKRVEHLALLEADALFPALAVRFHFVADRLAEAQHLGLHLQPLGQNLKLVLGGN